MKNESVGLRLLNKLDMLSQGQHIFEEVDAPENDGTAEDAAEANEETSETLKRLRGHLYRFQEAEGDKKAAGAGALTGAVGGAALARRSARKAYGLDGVAKDFAAKGAEASKNAEYFANKAVAKNAISKAHKAAGDKITAKGFAKSAEAAAGAANKAAAGVKKYGKAAKEAIKPVVSKGIHGGLRGAAIGAAAGYLGKKAYDHFKK